MSSGHSLKLSSGYKMDVVGLGTWKSKPDQVRQAVEVAIDCGYRHIDCAWIYGNEEEVGTALENKFKEGIVKREDLFITSKLWCCFHEPHRVRGALQETLQKLKLKYLDLYLMHNPAGRKFVEGQPFVMEPDQFLEIDYVETYKELEKLQKEGLIRSLGLSNFNTTQVGRVIKEASIKPAVNQVEIHPYLTQEPLVEFCQENDVVVTAYSPFSSPDSPWLKEGYKSVLENEILIDIAGKIDKTVAQVILRYLMQRGLIVIPKSVTPSRIQSNYQVFDFELTDEHMKAVASLNKNYRTCGWDIQEGHKYFPFNDDYKE